MRNLVRLALPALLFAAACSSSSTPSPAGAPADLANVTGTGGGAPSDGGLGKVSATVIVQVPANFKGTLRQLLVAAFDQFPVTGPPAGVLYQGTPSVSPGQALHLTADASGLSGDKYVLAVLYVQGGGQYSPMPGVDYSSAPTKVTFDGKPLDLGTLTLAVVPPADAGP